jgi:hypothetical protein
VDEILKLAGHEGEEYSFTRSQMVNTQEEIQSLVQAAQYLDSDYVVQKLLMLLGDGDKAKEMIEKMHIDELDRASLNNIPQSDEDEQDEPDGEA